MSITRISEFQAKPETIDDLRDLLISIIPIIRSSDGYITVHLYQNQDNRTKFTMIEVWDSIESHQASAKNIPAEKLAEIRPFLAEPPSGNYFALVQNQ